MVGEEEIGVETLEGREEDEIAVEVDDMGIGAGEQRDEGVIEGEEAEEEEGMA